MDLVVLQVPGGNTDPTLGVEEPLTSTIIGEIQGPEVSRTFSVNFDAVNVSGHLGQPGKERVAVAVAATGGRLLHNARDHAGQQRGQRDHHGKLWNGVFRGAQVSAPLSAPGAARRVD